MAAARYDIVIEQGATFTMTLRWTDDAGVPLSLSGMTARMQVRRNYRDADVLLNLTTENGGITLISVEGRIEVRGEATATALMPAMSSGVYDLELAATDGTVTRLIEGVATVTPEVTR
jgi:hypothetical protein